jgi:hypothetical protein
MSIDDMLDRMQIADAVERSTDWGVTERPPIKGVAYAAFAVHPPRPGKLLGLAVAHRAGEKFVVDLVRADVGIAESVAVLQRYGVQRVTGAVGDEADALAHAVCGAIAELQRGQLQ